MFNNIVLAVDGSEHGLHAARQAGDLARAVKTEKLFIVVAYDPIPTYLGEPNMQQAITGRLHEAESILEKAVEAVGQIPGEIRKEMLEGSPAEEVIKVAAIRQAGLIVIGSHGLSQLAGLVLGSQAQKVVSHAHCQVLTVR